MPARKVQAIIPARYASTRFPGKPLVLIKGKTMIERVYKQADSARLIDSVIVATDDERIAAEVRSFGGEVRMTGTHHVNGTERLAEVAARDSDYQIIVNIQGDEPLIDPEAIDKAIKPLVSDPSVEMSTIATPITSAEAQNPQQVKVVVDQNNFALYFSRAPVPFYRDEKQEAGKSYLGHIGLYVYTRSCLLRYAALPATRLEKAESLEQLRALENGIKIKVAVTDYRSLAVDTPEDLTVVQQALGAISV